MQKSIYQKSYISRTISLMLAFVLILSCFSIGIPMGAVASTTVDPTSTAATITQTGNTWTMENETLKTGVKFENGSIKMTSFYNKSADKEYLTDNSDSYLFSYTYGEYINGTVWSLNDYNTNGTVPAAGKNLVTLKSDDGSWTLGETKISDISMIPEEGQTEMLGKQLEITLINISNKFQVRLVFGVYDGMAGFHYQNYVKNNGDKKMVITESDVISLSFPNSPHYLHYVNALSSSSGGAENSTWKTITGSLPENTGRNALTVYSEGDGFWVMPETNWRTQDGPDVQGSKSEGTKSFNEFATTSVLSDGNPSMTAAPVKVACVGDSITFGVGSSIGKSYPSQLQSVLGPAFEVKNFGVGGRTLLKKGDYPYWNESAYTDSKNYQPDIVIIMLGTNDSKPQNWAYKNEYKADYLDLINQYRSLPSNPTIYVATSPIVAKDNLNISSAIVTNEIVPLQKVIAAEANCPIIDINTLTTGHTEWYTDDNVHPNDLGYANLASCFKSYVESFDNDSFGNMNVKVSTNPQSMQLTLKSGEEFQYIGVNITVFKGDVVDGKMSAEEHFQKRFKFNNTTNILNTNDWDYRGKRSYEYFRDVIVPQASKAKVDMVMIDDLWNTDRDSITAIALLKSLSDLGNLIKNAGMKFGIWYSLAGADHNGGRDLADPNMISEKKEQISTLITDYKMAHQMIDLTEFWQNKTETSYSSPCDNVYRKNVLSNQMLNSLVEEYPQYMVKLTNEVDVFPTQSNRNTGLLHLVNNGWIVHSGGVSGGLAVGANAFGYLPLSTYYNSGPVDGSMSLYYNYMFARNTKLSEDPGGPAWTNHGIDLMATFNGWRKGERVKALTDEVKRPTYLGDGWDNNAGSDTAIAGPYSWMYTNSDKSRALLIASSYGTTARKITADTRWVDETKKYLVADVTLDDVGQFTYKYKGVFDGSDLVTNGFDVDLTENTSGGKAYWFEEVSSDSMQVVFADEKATSYTSSVSGDTLSVTVNGTPGTTSTVIVADSANNLGRVCPVLIGQDGSVTFSVPSAKLYAPVTENENVNLGAPIHAEFETLFSTGKLIGSSSGVTFDASSTDASPSGGKYGMISFSDIGDYAVLKIDVPAPGEYDFKLVYKVNEKCAKVSIGQNGASISPVVDQSLGTLNSWLTQETRLTFSHAGENEVQVFYEGKGTNPSAPSTEGKSIRVDYIEYSPHTAADSVVIEAESLKDSAAVSTGATMSVVSDTSASGGEYLKTAADSAGTVIDLPITASSSGNYNVTVNFRTGSDGGRLYFLKDGKASGNLIDLYASSGNAIKSIDLGTIAFDSPSKNLPFIVSGRASGNTAGYGAAIDSIVMTPSPAVNISEAGNILTMGNTLDLTKIFSVSNMQPSYCVPSTVDYKIMSESSFDVSEISTQGILTANNTGTVVIRGSNKYDLTAYREYTVTVIPSGQDSLVTETIKAINLIGKPVYTNACNDAITQVEAKYKALNDTQKALVSNYYLLKFARYEYDILKSNAENAVSETDVGALAYVEDLIYITDGSSKIVPKYNPNGTVMQYMEGGTVYTHGFGFEPLSDNSNATGTMVVSIPKGADKFYARVGLGVSASIGNTYDQNNVVSCKINGELMATTGKILKNYVNGAWVDNTKQIEFNVPDGAEWLVIENFNGGINHADHIIITDARFENTDVLNVINLIGDISPENVNISEFKTETAQKIDTAEKAYYALDNESRKLVTNRTLLITHRESHSEFGILLLTDDALKMKVTAVNSKIQALPQVKDLAFTDMSAVLNASDTYKALSVSESYYVNNVDILISSEEYFESAYKTDFENVRKVTDLINNLPPVGELVRSDKFSIDAAKAAYDMLDSEQLQQMVYNEDTLTATLQVYNIKFPEGFLTGDLNFDGKVTVTDIVTLRGLILGDTEPTSAQMLAGDINNDKNLTVTDVVAIRAIIMG